MRARMASDRLPSRKTTRSPLPMSVAMTDTGKASACSVRSPASEPTSWLKKSLIFCPATTPCGPWVPVPVSVPGRKRCDRRLLR